MPAATIDESQSTGAPAGQRRVRLGDDVVAEGDVLGDVDLPAGVDHPHHHARDIVGEPRQVRLGADRRERLPVDLGGVADVVEHPLTLRVGVAQPVSVSGRDQHLTGRVGCRRPGRSRRSAGGRCWLVDRGRVASARTSAAECSQPGLPVQALTPSHGEFSSNTNPIGASTRRAVSATPSSRSKTSTERHGVITIGASIAARYSATRACSTPSGTAAPSATRPSSCAIQPTGGRVTGGHVAPGSADRREPVQQGPVSASSAIRQAFPRISANRSASATSVGTTRVGCTRTPVSRPASSSAAESSTSVSADVGAEPRDVAAAVVDAEPEPAGKVGQGRARPERGVQPAATSPRRPACAPSPGQRRGDDVADPLVGGRRQQPGGCHRVGDAAPAS